MFDNKVKSPPISTWLVGCRDWRAVGGLCRPALAHQPRQPVADAAAAGAEGTTIVFHSRLGSHADWHKSRVPLFEEQNPGIKLADR